MTPDTELHTSPSALETVTVGGVEIAQTCREKLANRMVDDWRLNQRHGYSLPPKMVFSANGQSISMVGRDTRFSNVIRNADIIHADGMSVVFASKILTRSPLPERVATTDFFHDAAAQAADTGMSFYLLGGSPIANARAVAAIRNKYPHLRLIGSHHGYLSDTEEQALVAEIAALKPDILWVSLGRPKQEYFCEKYCTALTGVTWLKTCGGLVDFLAGDRRRAPGWLQNLGMEWAYRVLQEPRRLFWRYATTNIHSIFRMAVLTRTARRNQAA